MQIEFCKELLHSIALYDVMRAKYSNATGVCSHTQPA